MNIFQRAMNAIRSSPSTNIGWYGTAGNGTSLTRHGRRIRYSEMQQLQNNLGWVFTATNRRALDVARLAVHVQKQTRDGQWENEPSHPLQILLENPSLDAEMNGFTLRYLLVKHLLLCGRMSLLVTDGIGNAPADLEVIPPTNIAPKKFSGELMYEIAVGGEYNSAQKKTLPAYRMRHQSGQSVLTVHLPETDPHRANQGASLMNGAGWNTELHSEVQSFATHFFRNNAGLGSVLESEKPFPGGDAAKQQREDFDQKFMGAVNAGKTGWLWGGLKIRTLGPAFNTLEYPALNAATRNDILGHFGTPAALFGVKDSSALGASEADAAIEIYERFTLESDRVLLEMMLNQLAVTGFGPEYRVQVASAIQEDAQRKEKRLIEEFDRGLISRLEYRTALGLSDDGLGDGLIKQTKTQIIPSFVEPEKPLPEPPPDPNADPNVTPVKPRAQAGTYRAIFASEYARLKRAKPNERSVLLLDFDLRWQREHPDLASTARDMRAFALEHTDLVTAFEALKSEGSRRLAQHASELEV